MSEPAAETPTSPPSLAAVFITVITAPRRAFASLSNTPAKAVHWVIPTLACIAIAGLHLGLIHSSPSLTEKLKSTRLAGLDQMLERGNYSDQDPEELRTFIVDYVDSGAFVRRETMLAAFASVAFLFGSSFALWMLAKLVFQTTLPYSKIVEFVGLSATVSALGAVADILLIQGTGHLFANLGPAILIADFDPTNAGHALLHGLNLVSIWFIAVLSTGMATMLNRPVKSVAIWLFGAWIVMKFGGIAAAF